MADYYNAQMTTSAPSPTAPAAPDAADRYDATYYAHACGNHPYQRDAVWLGFFGHVADQIAGQIAPKTVLDAGCAMGFLVETLRARGVEAFGVDISEYALLNVDPSVAAYCRLGSVAEPFDRRYDLITCIEVVEHLAPALGERTIANLCAHTDDILFSSSPEDFTELTHHNVQPPEYWAMQFAQHGFYRDLDFDATFLTPWAARFRRNPAPAPRLVQAYERKLWRLMQENEARRKAAEAGRDRLAVLEAEAEALRHAANTSDEQRIAAEARRAELALEVDGLWASIHGWEDHQRAVERSLGGRLIHGLQELRGMMAPPGSRLDRVIDALTGRS